MAERIRVAVVFGGQSAEHDVSLQSARFVLSALDPQRFEVVPVGITRAGRFLLGGDPLRELGAGAGEGTRALQVTQAAEKLAAVDVVFPVLHGPHGEDGTLQGFLELAGIPYVGSGVLGSAAGMDKVAMKMLFAQAGLPVAPYHLVRRGELGDPAIERRLSDLGYPLFVKPANMGSSVGISRAADPSELRGALTAAAAYDRRIIVEQGVDARELECGVLGNDEPEASVVGEVLSSHDFYDFEAKYDGSSRLQIPAEIPRETSERVRSLAVRAFLAVDGAGMARVDFFLERSSGQVFVNEINTIPGFTAFSMFPLLWRASGVDPQELCSRLVDLALLRAADRNRESKGEPPKGSG